MTFDEESAELVTDLVILAWFLAAQWSAGTEAPGTVEEQKGDILGATFRAAIELRKAGYSVPDVDYALSLDFRFNSVSAGV